jgi:hypothetical protein
MFGPLANDVTMRITDVRQRGVGIAEGIHGYEHIVIENSLYVVELPMAAVLILFRNGFNCRFWLNRPRNWKRPPSAQGNSLRSANVAQLQNCDVYGW